MAQAIMLECRANKKGNRGKRTVSHETAPKARAVYTNLWLASPWAGVDVSFALKN